MKVICINNLYFKNIVSPFDSLPLQLNFQCVNFNICFFSRPVSHAHIFVHCYSIDKEQFCSEMGWKLLESMWRNSLSQSCKFYSKWHTVFFFPDCIITAKCILLHHGNGLKLYWLEYQSVFRSNLPCTVFHGNALQRLQCAATVLLELDTHTVAMQEQCVLNQASPTDRRVGRGTWQAQPRQPPKIDFGPVSLVSQVSPFSQVDSSQQWSAFVQLAHPPDFGAC